GLRGPRVPGRPGAAPPPPPDRRPRRSPRRRARAAARPLRPPTRASGVRRTERAACRRAGRTPPTPRRPAALRRGRRVPPRPWRSSCWWRRAPRRARRSASCGRRLRRRALAFGGVFFLVAELRTQSLGIEPLLAQEACEGIDRAVRHPDLFGAGRADRLEQVGPVGVVGEHEAAIDRAPPPLPAHLHPPRGEAGREV